MPGTQELSVIHIQVGSFEGHPIFNTVTVSDQEQMLKDGLTMSDILEIASIHDGDWQKDC
jgi:hypothetical protein